MNTLRTRVTAIAVGGLIGALVLVGLGTAGLLHQRAGASLDRTLLAAALAGAHPGAAYSNDTQRSSVEVGLWDPARPIVASELYTRAVYTELPVWVDQDGRRILLLAVEEEHGPGTHPHEVMVASARAVSWRSSTLPFLASYLGVAVLVVLLSAVLLRSAMAVALAPLQRATREIGQVGGMQVGRRLDEDGPPEVQRLLVATNQLLARLESAFATQASFTAQAAHELRTPVTLLRGEIELALRRERSAEGYRGVLERLFADVARLHDLVEGLLLLARVDAGQIEQGKAVERVSAPVHRALAQERDALEAAGCRVSASLGADPELPMHAALLTTALATLLRNVAVHAPGSQVWVDTRIEGDELQITVRDDGPGIPDPARVLERSPRDATGGLGLGLPLAREIARRHGGDLRLASDGAGTVATLSLASSEP